MAILVTGNTWVEDEQLTAASMNLMWTGATFHADAVDDSTIEINGSGKLQVAGLGITVDELRGGAVTGAKIGDNAVGNEHIEADAVSGTGSGQGALDANIKGASIGSSEIGVAAIENTHTHVSIIASQTVLTDDDLIGDSDSFMAWDASSNNLRELTLLRMSDYEGFPKAWGVADFTTGSSTAVTNGWNVQTALTSLSTVTSFYHRTVSFPSGWAMNTPYTVMLSQQGNPAITDPENDPYLVSAVAGSFVIASRTSNAVYAHFTLFGSWATINTASI